MCLIVHRPTAGAHLPNAIIDSNLSYNDDGFGLAWREGGRLRYRKFGPADHQAFKAFLKKIDQTDNEYMAHFRMTTHGPSNKDMAHPYLYSDEEVGDVLVFHNGIIPISTPSDKSDTLVFVESVLSQLPSKWWEQPALKYLVESGIGYSRLGIMTGEESIRITGDNKWVFQNGIYYSTTPMRSTTTSWQYNGGWNDEDWYKTYQSNSAPKASSAASGASSEKNNDKQIGFSKLTAGQGTVGKSWIHVGHTVEPTDEPEIVEGEAYGEAWCRNCDTLGEYYIIDNKVYVELSHKVEKDDDEEYAQSLTHCMDCGLFFPSAEEHTCDPKVFLLPETASSSVASKA